MLEKFSGGSDRSRVFKELLMSATGVVDIVALLAAAWPTKRDALASLQLALDAM